MQKFKLVVGCALCEQNDFFLKMECQSKMTWMMKSANGGWAVHFQRCGGKKKRDFNGEKRRGDERRR
jgi:hypothetical protein